MHDAQMPPRITKMALSAGSLLFNLSSFTGAAKLMAIFHSRVWMWTVNQDDHGRRFYKNGDGRLWVHSARSFPDASC